MIDDWFKEQENKLEQDTDVLPAPFNDVYEVFMDVIENL